MNASESTEEAQNDKPTLHINAGTIMSVLWRCDGWAYRYSDYEIIVNENRSGEYHGQIEERQTNARYPYAVDRFQLSDLLTGDIPARPQEYEDWWGEMAADSLESDDYDLRIE